MTILSLYINCMLLTDVGRRSLYIRAAVLGRFFWVQWWPRSAKGNRLTAGYLKERK